MVSDRTASINLIVGIGIDKRVTRILYIYFFIITIAFGSVEVICKKTKNAKMVNITQVLRF